jgi:hypothetical protein
MLGWIIQITFISVILIFLIHNIVTYLKKTLTIPKVKDLVNSQKYDEIYKIINTNDTVNKLEYDIDELLPKSHHNNDITSNIDINVMKNELKNFFKNQFDDEIL